MINQSVRKKQRCEEDSPPKASLQEVLPLNRRIREKGNLRRTGPAYTAGARAMKEEILFPMSGRIPRESARNTDG